MATSKKQKVVDIEIPALELQIIELRLIGKGILVTNNAKHLKETLAKAQGIKGVTPEISPGGRKKKREMRDPEFEYNRARYRINDDLDGFPAFRVKEALVDTAYTFADVPKNIVRRALFVQPEYDGWLVPIEHDQFPPKMNSGTERVGGQGGRPGAPDLRWRPEYNNWSIPIRIEYETNFLNASQIINLVAKAGFHTGIGEHRPEKQGGTWGTFGVMSEDEYQTTLKKTG